MQINFKIKHQSETIINFFIKYMIYRYTMSKKISKILQCIPDDGRRIIIICNVPISPVISAENKLTQKLKFLHKIKVCVYNILLYICISVSTVVRATLIWKTF